MTSFMTLAVLWSAYIPIFLLAAVIFYPYLRDSIENKRRQKQANELLSDFGVPEPVRDFSVPEIAATEFALQEIAVPEIAEVPAR